MTYEEILKQFFTSEKTTDYSLEPIREACEYFGHPERTFQSIHIAGTNGKGSVSKMVFQMLKERGEKVGVFTSPHLVDICERFETEKGIMTHEEFARYALVTLDYPKTLSYFERCTLIAFLYFRDRGCTFAVIEVGMGGRLDATNIITPIVTAITNISYDHMEFLGESLESIAREKGGIIKESLPIVLGERNPTLEEIARERHAPVTIATHRDLETNLVGAHQQRNASVAWEIGKILGIEEEQIREALLHVTHHGRLEYIRENVLIDGAHNESGLEVLASYLETLRERWKSIAIFTALKKGKNISLFLTVFPHIRSWGVIEHTSLLLIDSTELSTSLENQGYDVRRLTPREILESAERSPDTLFVICGSLYALGDFLR